MNEPVTLQPLLLLVEGAPALWRLDEGTLALAVFTDKAVAEQYAAEFAAQQPWKIASPEPVQAVRAIAECVRQGVIVAALNPAASKASRLFDLKAILRQARDKLRTGEPLTF